MKMICNQYSKVGQGKIRFIKKKRGFAEKNGMQKIVTLFSSYIY